MKNTFLISELRFFLIFFWCGIRSKTVLIYICKQVVWHNHSLFFLRIIYIYVRQIKITWYHQHAGTEKAKQTLIVTVCQGEYQINYVILWTICKHI